MAFYNYAPQRVSGLGIGVGNYAFEPEHGLPLYTVRGPGTLISRVIGPGKKTHQPGVGVTQPTQMMYAQAQTIIGMAGIPAGSIVGQPLVSWDDYLANLGLAEG